MAKTEESVERMKETIDRIGPAIPGREQTTHGAKVKRANSARSSRGDTGQDLRPTDTAGVRTASVRWR